MTRRRQLLAATAMILLAACGTASPSDPNGHARTGTWDASPSPSASQVIEQADWRLAEPAEGTELDIVVPVPSPGACGFFERVHVTDTAERVTIETYIRRRIPGSGESCPDHLAFETVAVTLEGDIGDRRLEGCDAPPDGRLYFDEAVPSEGCIAAITEP